MWSRYPYNPTPYDDDWEDQPSQGPFYKWALGVLVPLGLIIYGIHAIITRQATFDNRFPITFHNLNAIAFGSASLSAGLFLHCHYFWGNIYNQAWFAVLGKILAAIGFITGLGILLVRNGLLGIK